jgi:hypothetical protein
MTSFQVEHPSSRMGLSPTDLSICEAPAFMLRLMLVRAILYRSMMVTMIVGSTLSSRHLSEAKLTLCSQKEYPLNAALRYLDSRYPLKNDM